MDKFTFEKYLKYRPKVYEHIVYWIMMIIYMASFSLTMILSYKYFPLFQERIYNKENDIVFSMYATGIFSLSFLFFSIIFYFVIIEFLFSLVPAAKNIILWYDVIGSKTYNYDIYKKKNDRQTSVMKNNYMCKLLKYKYLLIVVICLLLSGCFFRPCNTTLSIKNEGNNGKIILIDRDGNYYNYEIENNEIKYFNKETMEHIVYVFIRTEKIEGIFELRENDHWFPVNHNVEVIIGINEFNYKADRKKIYNDYSYDTYIKIDKEIDKEVDFETVKKERYSEIYDIIK